MFSPLISCSSLFLVWYFLLTFAASFCCCCCFPDIFSLLCLPFSVVFLLCFHYFPKPKALSLNISLWKLGTAAGRIKGFFKVLVPHTAACSPLLALFPSLCHTENIFFLGKSKPTTIYLPKQDAHMSSSDVSAPNISLLLCLALMGCFIPRFCLVGWFVGVNVPVPAANTHPCPALVWVLAFVVMLFPWWYSKFQHKPAASPKPANTGISTSWHFSSCVLQVCCGWSGFALCSQTLLFDPGVCVQGVKAVGRSSPPTPFPILISILSVLGLTEKLLGC